MKKKDRAKKRTEAGENTATNRIANAIKANTGIDTRVVVPGHILRGGGPSAYDRVLATKFGCHAAKLIAEEKYGVAVAMINTVVSENPLSEIAGKSKLIVPEHQLVQTARNIGISFGD